MKLITFAVPCYNSAAFMRECADSLLALGSGGVEIIIIDDGSSDATADIADGYARLFPGAVKVIHQANAGHGGAINAGLAAAEGKYFKVVDSDDRAGAAAYKEVLAALAANDADLFICNYVYEKKGRAKHKVIGYAGALPEGRVIGWEETRRFPLGKYLLMHSLIYRTEILRQSGLSLPWHTFYVDNLFAYIPLPYVKTLYYINADFYRYTIGQEGQSVQEGTMIKRISQQIAVNRLMLKGAGLGRVENSRLAAYMLHYLEIVTCVTMILLIRAKTKEALAKKDALWAEIKSLPKEYSPLRRSALIRGMCALGAFGRVAAVAAYRLARLVYGFN